jgi:hypothetical protein
MDQRAERDSSGNSDGEPGVRDEEVEATKSKRSKLNKDEANHDEAVDKNANKGVNKILSAASLASSGFALDDDDAEEDLDDLDHEAEVVEVKRGKAAAWIVESKFDSAVTFMDSIQYKDLMDNYNTDSKKETKNGDIVRTWVCKFSKKKKGFSCPVKARTVHSGLTVTVSRLGNVDHMHEVIKDSSRKYFVFTNEVEAKISELVELNVESRLIRKHLVDKGFFTEDTAPSEKVLYNKTYQIRNKLNKTRKNIGLRDLEQLIEENKAEPEDDKEPYILKHSVSEDDDGRLRFSILFTSKYLIKTFMQEGKDWVLCVDNTYQTNVEDTPLMFFGSSTKEGKFNGIGAVLSNREDTTAFKFLFETVKEIAEPAPVAIMADADKAISRAIRETFPATVRLTCFFHLMKNVKQRLGSVKSTDPSIYHKIMEDLRGLQAGAVDKVSFSILYGLFKKKWVEDHVYSDPGFKVKVVEFFLYFDKVNMNDNSKFSK